MRAFLTGSTVNLRLPAICLDNSPVNYENDFLFFTNGNKDNDIEPVKSKALKKVGKNAFKGINKKAVIKVPAAKVKAYKKLLAKKCQSSTVKIK